MLNEYDKLTAQLTAVKAENAALKAECDRLAAQVEELEATSAVLKRARQETREVLELLQSEIWPLIDPAADYPAAGEDWRCAGKKFGSLFDQVTGQFVVLAAGEVTDVR